jgi:hypothetical protein
MSLGRSAMHWQLHDRRNAVVEFWLRLGGGLDA